MASSMLNGDRRLASTRKGMTVLGKVPKPINLPSQRLENHGLDPNVEIVPKGTLTWGSRQSPTTPNAWGLSNYSSLNADGNVDPLTRFSGRPSSSGSGTRPSTAGSDISSEHVASAWKSNSRPSSASGSLVSNQTQPTARPQSAETRPGSSQLSRFADSTIGHSGPWGSAVTAHKMGPAYPETTDFSLSSGDFPSLGSEKNSELHYEPDGHAINAPTAVPIVNNSLEISRSGTEKIDMHSDKQNENSLKTENPPSTSDAMANVGSWHGNLHNMQLATSLNSAQSLSNPWQGHPQNLSDGIWYQGVPSVGPCRPLSAAPSGKLQSDTCYPSQVPVRLAPSSHSASSAGGHPTHYQNKNGGGFHLHPPDPLMVQTMPIIPVRPGVCHGAALYSSHTPAALGGQNIRERSIMGSAPDPPGYGQFANQTFYQKPIYTSLKPNAHTQLSDDKIEITRQHEFSSAQYRVLLKHHNHPVGTYADGSRDQPTTSTTLSLEKNSDAQAVYGHGIQQNVIKNDLKIPTSGGTSHFNDLQGCAQEASPADLSEKLSGKVGDNVIKKGETSTSSPEVSHLTTRDIKLIEKIESLNSKARFADCCLENLSIKDDNARRDDGNLTHAGLRNSVPSGSSFGGSYGTGPPNKCAPQSESAVSSSTKILECGSFKALPIQLETHASTFSVFGSSGSNAKAHAECTRTQNVKRDPLSKSRMNDHSSRSGFLHMDKPRDESLDTSNYTPQRAKMKEIAMQRAKQLQQEEEERNREQKVKALAKLEELNQRAENNSSGSIFPEVGVATSGDVPKRHDDPTPPITCEPDNRYSDRATLKHKDGPDMNKLGKEPDGRLPDTGFSKRNAYNTGKTKGTKAPYLDSPKDCQHSASADQIIMTKNGQEDSFKKNNIQCHDDCSSKKGQVSHSQKQNIQGERNLDDKAVVSSDIAGSENLMEGTTETALHGKLTNSTCNPSIQQRRNERSNKNKKKSEAALENAYFLPAVQAKGILEKPADFKCNQKNLEDDSVLPILETGNAGTSQNFRATADPSNQGLLEAARGSAKAANHWNSSSSRRSSRNGQSRPVDKFQGKDNVVWAPVRPSKDEPAEESQGSKSHALSATSTGINIPSNVKSRRAELQRYIPKVVKDAPQEGNMQISDCQPPVEMVITDNVFPNSMKEVGFAKLDSVTVRKDAGHTQTNRHEKNYSPASWHKHGSEDGSVGAASTGMNLPDWKQLEDASSSSHAIRSNDILVTMNLKEQGNTNKSRRQQKVHKVISADAKDSTGMVQSIAFDWNATHVKSTAGESLNQVERAKSQWKPKAQSISSHSNQQGMGSGSGKNASQTITHDNECPIITDQHAWAPDKNIAGKTTNMDERCHQPRRERKELALENHNNKAGQDGENYQVQPAAGSLCQQHGMQHVKGKTLRYGGRFNKGQDSSYGNRQNCSASSVRQRQTSHNEYQRTEAHTTSDQFQSLASNMKDVPSGFAATGPKFGEKTQGHKKDSPHFYVRSSAPYQDDRTSGQQS